MNLPIILHPQEVSAGLLPSHQLYRYCSKRQNPGYFLSSFFAQLRIAQETKYCHDHFTSPIPSNASTLLPKIPFLCERHRLLAVRAYM